LACDQKSLATPDIDHIRPATTTTTTTTTAIINLLAENKESQIVKSF